jgi:two-component system OmpR family sensor kinase
MAALWRVNGMDVEASATPGATAVGTSSVLAQVLTNLLTNCARYAPGAPVRIVATRCGDRIVVQVRDEGAGRRETYAAGPQRCSGAGIGLQISRRLVEAQGGALRVHEPDPRWPGFVVTVELVAGPAPPPVPRRAIEVRAAE